MYMMKPVKAEGKHFRRVACLNTTVNYSNLYIIYILIWRRSGVSRLKKAPYFIC